MAYDGIEVEIKLRASEQVAKAIKAKLLQVNPTQIHHVDTYFDNPLKSFIKAIPIKEWLSVRNRGNKVIINHKYWHFDNDGNSTHSDEAELLVDNADEATRLMKALGFQPLITVNKRRTEGMIDTMLVSVDDVEELGYFIEIEATKSVGTTKETRDALIQFATILGLDITDIDQKGYPHLLLEKHLGYELSR